jgi:hypothetical protein
MLIMLPAPLGVLFLSGYLYRQRLVDLGRSARLGGFRLDGDPDGNEPPRSVGDQIEGT